MKKLLALLFVIGSISAFADHADFHALNFKKICSSDFQYTLSARYESIVVCNKNGLAQALTNSSVSEGAIRPETTAPGINPKGWMTLLRRTQTWPLINTKTSEIIGYRTRFEYDVSEVFVVSDINGDIALLRYFGFN